MLGCDGCSCVRPAVSGSGASVLLATRVSHTAAALRARVADLGGRCVQRAPGMLEVSGPSLDELVAGLRAGVSSVEAAEVRVAVPDDARGDSLLAAALVAPTLAEVAARTEHADLLPLFADELNAFRSVYQPIVSLAAGPAVPPLIGYEALLRASGPDGSVMPSTLFAAAESAGWLHVLDRVGRTTALRGAAGWLQDRLLFVNFLPTTIYRPQVCLQTTERAARRAGLRLDQLVFEVTESEKVKDLGHLSEVFAYYRDRGCRVALDDLGSGYSSLNLLVRLQPDIVKLDREIVTRLPGRAAAAVVSAVVEITHAYGGQVLAECVETADQAAAAVELGVDLGQGWFFGRPLERAALTGPDHGSRDAGPSQDRARASTPGAVAAAAFSGNDGAVALAAPDLPGAPDFASAPDLAGPPEDPGREGPVAGSAGGSEPVRRGGTAGLPAERGSADVEALLARAVQVSGTGITIADATTADMPLIWVNEGFEQLTGYRAAEAVGAQLPVPAEPRHRPAGPRRTCGRRSGRGRSSRGSCSTTARTGRPGGTSSACPRCTTPPARSPTSSGSSRM